MAGGTILVVGVDERSRLPGDVAGRFIGTGMHGGTIYVRGEVDKDHLGQEVEATVVTAQECGELRTLLKLYATYFPPARENSGNMEIGSGTRFDLVELSKAAKEIVESVFTRIRPASSRPYKNLYSSM